MRRFAFVFLVFLLSPISSQALASIYDAGDHHLDSYVTQIVDTQVDKGLNKSIFKCADQEQLHDKVLAVGCCEYCGAGRACSNTGLSRGQIVSSAERLCM